MRMQWCPRDEQLCRVLHRRARWCFLHRCWNNIYTRAGPDPGELSSQTLIHKFFPLLP